MKVAEVIEKVNNTKYWSLYSFEEDFDLEMVAHGLYVDKHRWYEISTSVYKCEDGYVGVNGVSQLFSEDMSYSDVDCPCIAEEFVPKQVTTYVPANADNITNMLPF
jgi:hypothetical protein